MLGAGFHVLDRDTDKMLFASFHCENVCKELSNWISRKLSNATSRAPLLRNLLAEPNSFCDTVLPVIAFKHDTTN